MKLQTSYLKGGLNPGGGSSASCCNLSNQFDINQHHLLYNPVFSFILPK